MGKKRDSSSQRPSRPLIEELEPRILYSADALAFAPDPAVGVEIRAIDTGFADLTASDSNRVFSGSLLAEQTVAAQEIIFVDTGVAGYEELLEDLLLSLPEDTQPAIILLDTKTDGIEQISSSLAEYQNVSAIHILSHANSGEVTLGSTTLDNANLDDFANTLLNWNDYLTPDADILIYGCNLAVSDDGVALIDNIAALTGADVAASDDLTGNAAAGGDWELEYRVGEIEALTLAASPSTAAWNGVLSTSLTPTGEMRVNTSTAGTQETTAQSLGSHNAVAMDSAGNYVVVWTDSGTDGSGYGIFAQRFDATGTKQGAEFQVNETTTGDQRWVSVAMADNGNFTVTWTSFNQDGTASSVYARQFNASGSPASGEFKVNQSSGAQSNSAIAMNGAGQFIIAWQGNGSGDNNGIYFRLFDAAGNGGLETRANSSTSNAQTDPAVAINDNGAAAIVWDDGNDAYLTLIASDGTLSSTDTQVNPLRKSTEAAVALDNNGNSIVAFAYNGFGEDGIYYRRFDASGNDITTTTGFGQPPSISTSHSSDATSPSLAMDKSSGDFIVTWQETGDGSGTAVYAKAFALNQDLIWDTERINQTTTNDQINASVAMLDTNNFVVAWSGEGVGDSSGVFTRQFGTNTPNQAPSLDSTALNIDENSSSLSLSATDPEGDSITYSLTGGSDVALFSLDTNTGVLTFNTAPDYEAPGDTNGDNVYELEITVSDDQGASAIQPIIVTVTNLNDNAPVLAAIENTPLGYTENDTATPITGSIALSDADNGNITSATVRITGNYQAGEDILAYTGAGNITATWDAATGTLTLNGSDTVANYQAALRSVSYSNGSENPSVATRTVSFSVNDGVTDSNTVTRNIAVTAVNDSPSLSLNASPSVTEGGSVTLTRTQLNASDPDDSATDLTYSVTGGLANGQLELTTNPGVAISSFTQDDIDNSRVIYVHDGSQTSSDSLSFSLADGGEDGVSVLTGTFSITVSNSNDAPVNTVPGAQSVDEDTALAITGISVADADDNIASVELSVANGTLSLTLAGSANLLAGASGTSTLTLTGPRADINATLATLTYQGNLNFIGTDTLTVRTTDTSGTNDANTVDITINPVNDAPEISASATLFSANMIGIAALDTQQITITDPDSSSKPLQLTLVAESGKIHVDTGSRQITVLSGNNTANVTLSGTLVELNALLHGSDASEGGISWSGKLESDARQVDLQITVDDQGNSGGNAKTVTQHFTIDVPASHANQPIVLDEDAEPLQLAPYRLFGIDTTATQLTFSVSDIADPDLLDATISTANDGAMLTLIPLADQHGETSIKLTAQTSTGNRLETTLSVIVNSIPDAPVIAIQPIEGATNNAVRVVIAPNAADATDSDINFFYISGISGGELYYADGESKIENNSFISREEADAGLIFIPENGVATASTLRFFVLGAFNDRGLPPGAKAAEFSFDVQPPQVAQTPPPSKIELTDIPTPETLTHDDDQNTEDSGALLLRQAIKDAEQARERKDATTPITLPITIQPVHTMPASEEALDDFSVLGNDGARKSVDRASFAQLITRYLDEIERQKDVLVVTSYEHLFESLERLRDEFHELGLSDRTVIGSAVVASAGLSAGYVVWMLRGGLLISSMMFSVPAWSIADPLTILAAQRDEEDDDSLEDIARKGARKKNQP